MKTENLIKQKKLFRLGTWRFALFLMVLWAITFLINKSDFSLLLFISAFALTMLHISRISGQNNGKSDTINNNGSHINRWRNNSLNPCNSTGFNMRSSRSNNYR